MGVNRVWYKCETCNHYHKHSDFVIGDCDILDHWLTSGEYHFIQRIGCASHSDLENNLNKLLDDKINWLQTFDQDLPQWNARSIIGILEDIHGQVNR